MQRLALNVAAVFYALVSVVHLVRYFKKIEVKIGSTEIPVAASVPAATLSLSLALWMAGAARATTTANSNWFDWGANA